MSNQQPQVVIDARKQEEADFHNRREVDRKALSQEEFGARYANKKWYSIARRSDGYLDQWVEKECQGKVGLDYCCGLGGTSLKMAQAGAFVHGIDISAESVETAEGKLHSHGYGDRCQMQVMDAENLTYPDSTFDVIVCSGVLHHLDLNRAYPELARVLKPTGKILCNEPLAHNPIIQAYRRLTPSLRTAWEVDHILKKKDLNHALEHFGMLRARYYHLSTIAAAPLRRTPLFGAALTMAEAMDAVLLSVPLLQLMAWQVVFELSEPRHAVRQRKAA